MKKKLLYLALIFAIVFSMLLFSGCSETSNLSGSALNAAEEVGDSPQGSDVAEPESEAIEQESIAAVAAGAEYEEMVWIPRTGSKYHSNPECSRMKDPSHVTLSEAESRGYTPCSKCY